MKTLTALSALVLALSACGDKEATEADSTTETPVVETLESLKAQVGDLTADIDGKVLGTCDGDKILSNSEAYGDVMEGLPGEKLKSDAWHAANAERQDVMVTASGLQYKVVQAGIADSVKPKETEKVKVHYHGMFTNGTKFDSSYDRSAPSEFYRNQVIKGWIEALGDMQVCEARTLYIPGKLAYGLQGRPGSIPPNATLIFNVQLLGVRHVGYKEKLADSESEKQQLRDYISKIRTQ